VPPPPPFQSVDRRRRSGFGWSRLPCLWVLLVLLSAPLLSQTDQRGEQPYEVKEIEFEGNETLSDKALRSVMTTKESPNRLSAFFYDHISERLGSKREYFNPDIFGVDIENIRAIYRDNGCFSAAVDTSLTFDEVDRTVSVKLMIAEGYRSLVDSLSIIGLESIAPGLTEEIGRGRQVRIGAPYNAHDVTFEGQRILGFLFNHGYPEAKLDSTRVERRLSTDNVSVILAYTSGRRYTVGKITITAEDGSSADVDERFISRYLELETGEVYSLEQKLQSERNLSRLGIFETIKLDARLPAREDTSTSVPIFLILKPRDKHELTPEIFVNDVNNAFNLGMGLGYNNRNFFGSARNFSTRGTMRVQSIQRIRVLRMFTASGFRQPSLVANAELSLQLLQPYLFSNKVSGTWTFSLIADKQKPYLQSIIRNRIGVSNQFTQRTFGFFEWNLERMSVEIFDSTSASFFTGEQRPQLNSILVATLQRDMTNDILSPSSGFFASVSLEEGGIVPALLKNFGSNLPFSQYYKLSAYGRWYADLSKDRYAILALKAKAGFSEPYRFERKPGEENLPVPLNRRFFAGGSGSVRGWRTRELAAVDRPQFGGNATIEASVESRINILRGLGSLWQINLNGVWMVLFLDMGNVWNNLSDVHLRQLAVASGLGIRYDTIFGPVRVDFGFRVFDPLERENHRWFTTKRFWKETVSNGVLHFGIGHAF
jgi:outer membrane protein insertion porin family